MRNFAGGNIPCGNGDTSPRTCQAKGFLGEAFLLRENCPVVGAADARSQGPKICTFYMKKNQGAQFCWRKKPLRAGDTSPRIC